MKKTVLTLFLASIFSEHVIAKSHQTKNGISQDALVSMMTDITTPRETRDDQAIDHLKTHDKPFRTEDLINAIEQGLTKTALHLIAQKPHPESLHTLLTRLIDIAIRNHNVSIVTALVDLQAETERENAYTNALFNLLKSIEFSNNHMPRPMAEEHKRKRDDQLQILLFLVDRGADLNARLTHANTSETPLSLAVRNGDLQPVEFLVSRGAIVAPPDNIPLLTAIEYRWKDIVNFLLKKGAPVNQPLVTTITLAPTSIVTIKKYPLIQALKTEEPDIAIITDLINARADINVRGFSLGGAEETPLTVAIEGRHEKIALMLLERGAQLPSKVGNRMLVHAAAYMLMADVIKQLIKQHAPITTDNATGMTPLHDACRQWSLDADASEKLAIIADTLIKNGVDINRQDAQGNTALHYAISSRFPSQTIASLMAYHPDITIKNNLNKTPLDLAREEQVREVPWNERSTIEHELRQKQGTDATIKSETIQMENKKNWDQIMALIENAQ